MTSSLEIWSQCAASVAMSWSSLLRLTTCRASAGGSPKWKPDALVGALPPSFNEAAGIARSKFCPSDRRPPLETVLTMSAVSLTMLSCVMTSCGLSCTTRSGFPRVLMDTGNVIDIMALRAILEHASILQNVACQTKICLSMTKTTKTVSANTHPIF